MISGHQEQQIIDVVRSSQIQNSALKDDLIDHLCCLVEMKMAKGAEFGPALESALEQTAPGGLNEIEKETIFLLNYSKIMFVKRLTYAAGYLFALAWVVGIFFKFMHLQGAMILMFLGGSGLAFIFLPLLLINRYKNLASQVLSERLKWILGTLSFFLFMVSSWMKFAHLQGAPLILGVSFLVFGFGFLPFLFFRMYKKSISEP